MNVQAVRATRLFTDYKAQEQVDALLKRLEELKEDFDRGISVQMLLDAQRAVLNELKPLGDARYDSTRACLAGTRERLLQEVVDWCLRSDASENLLWIYGQAGLGKSAIATSLCQQLDKDRRLAASFFCKRDDVQRRDPQRVLTTVIHGLALQDSSYAKAVITAIQRDGSLCSSPMQSLYEKLVEELLPLQETSDGPNPTPCHAIVVDALDECGTQDSRQQLLRYLCGLSRLLSWLKVVVTSRPDQDLKDYFGDLSMAGFACRDMHRYDATDDIHTFVSQQLKSSSRKARYLPDGAAKMLADGACGLFIWAQTACKLVLSDHDPSSRLDSILRRTQTEKTLSPLDTLYTTAIECTLENDNEDNVQAIQRSLGAIVVCSTRTPLPVEVLSELLAGRLKRNVLQSVVDTLGSVLYVDDQRSSAVRVYHPSFADYLTTPSRSKRFYVEVERRNAEIFESCMNVMILELGFNICGLESSYKYNRDVPDLAERVDAAISQRLQYSCVYWTSHLVDCTRDDTTVQTPLLNEIIAGLRALYWIEVLSLMGRTFYDPISQSTPHLYLSGLAFLPARTRIKELRQTRFLNTIRIERGEEQTWSPWLRCMSHESEVRTLSISPDGRYTVSGFLDGTLRIWTTDTGFPVGKPLIGHSKQVNSVAFSPDGHRVVSGSYDKALRVWDSAAGAPIGGPLVGHHAKIESVAYSPNGRLLASAAGDQTVRLWNADTGALVLRPFMYHSQPVWCVAFSPDSAHIISGSSDKILRIWDVATGTLVNTILTGHSNLVYCVSYSADGSRIVSGSVDRTLRVWDARTCTPVHKPLTGHSDVVWSVAFHPHLNLVASGSGDRTIRVWDLDTGVLALAPFTGHLGSIHAVSFTPDGRRIVSSSEDRTVRVWDVSLGLPTKYTSVGHFSSVSSVCFSSDGRRIVSGSHDLTVRVWDAETGDLIGGPLIAHSGRVHSVALSPDGCLIASCSADKTARLWDAATLTPIGDPLIGHSDEVTCVVFSFDSQYIATGSLDKTTRVWHVASRTLVKEPLASHTGPVTCVQFSPDHRHLVFGSQSGVVRLWEMETSTMVETPPTPTLGKILSVSFSYEGHQVIFISEDPMIQVWDLDACTCISLALTGHGVDPLMCAVVSPNGRLAAAGSLFGQVHFWDVTTGAPIDHSLVGHGEPIVSLKFSHDGLLLVSGSDDWSVRVWDTSLIPQIKPLHFNTSEAVSQASLLAKRDNSALDPAETLIPRHIQKNNCFQLPRHINQLAGCCNLAGWVCTENGELLFWLPPEYRRELDDSVLVISSNPALRTVLLDYSSFVHGTNWSDVHVL
ncbi:hypothetical protein FRC07_014898 [Ceratobasidium sp. 392]|nr:hypothetical protein FRC07_014898 [Ceratobasidium sp. 392]